LSRVVILRSARSQSAAGKVLENAAQVYKVNTEAITPKVKQEFTAKETAKAEPKPTPKAQKKAAKKQMSG